MTKQEYIANLRNTLRAEAEAIESSVDGRSTRWQRESAQRQLTRIYGRLDRLAVKYGGLTRLDAADLGRQIAEVVR